MKGILKEELVGLGEGQKIAISKHWGSTRAKSQECDIIECFCVPDSLCILNWLLQPVRVFIFVGQSLGMHSLYCPSDLFILL